MILKNLFLLMKVIIHIVLLNTFLSYFMLSAIEKLPDISVDGRIRNIPIYVSSSNDWVKKIAKKAFSLHGAFDLKTSADNAYTLKFINILENEVYVELNNGKNVIELSAKGTDLKDAVLRSCDEVVQTILKIPSFFAGKIVFIGEKTGFKEVWQSDMLFYKVNALTSNRSDSLSPQWSPNGKKILYTTYFNSGFPDLFLIENFMGVLKQRPFAHFKGINTGGTYSPNGLSVAMVLSQLGNPEIHISNSNGRKIRRLTKNKSLETSPDWSPDNNRLLFTSDRMGNPQLYVLDINQGSVVRVETNGLSRYLDQGDWNPLNHNLIAFTMLIEGRFQIGLFDMVKKTGRELTNESADCVSPCWLNDGRHLIFTRKSKNYRQLYLLDTHSSIIKPLSSKQFGKASQADFVYLD